MIVEKKKKNRELFLLAHLFLSRNKKSESTLASLQNLKIKMDNFICGGYIFTSNFDSGNLQKVELVKWHEGTNSFSTFIFLNKKQQKKNQLC